MAITLSAGVRSNLQALQGVASLLASTQNRLATGKKINNALDDPSAFFTAQNLSDRSGKLTKLLDGINTGVSTIKAASTGLDSIYKQLQSAQGIIDSVKANSGSVSNQAKSTTVVNNATTLSSLGFVNNDTITLTDTVTSGTTTISLGTIGTHNVQDLINSINAQGNGQYTAGISNGNFYINSNSANAFNITGTTAAAITATFGTTTGSTTSGSYDQTTLNSYAKQFNSILSSIDQFANDSSFNGVNLLKSGNDLTIKYNEDGTSNSTVTSRNADSASFGLSSVSLTASTVTDFTSKISTITSALSSVRLYQSDYASQLSIAQNRQDFTKSLADLLTTGSDNLTNADQNLEAANVLALQTRQSLGQSALSLSNQADQAVLQLLR
ncbi:flagellar protein [Terrarubrum flagellatum]|uniref:flagellin N-terminal helical domain-containing protein n=1 Tax=Terrirubrum flagellatum TaxID=2895980 RepID=UPI003144E40D